MVAGPSCSRFGLGAGAAGSRSSPSFGRRSCGGVYSSRWPAQTIDIDRRRWDETRSKFGEAYAELFSHLDFIEGSSVAPETLAKIAAILVPGTQAASRSGVRASTSPAHLMACVGSIAAGIAVPTVEREDLR
jgi:hypothetical protein